MPEDATPIHDKQTLCFARFDRIVRRRLRALVTDELSRRFWRARRLWSPYCGSQSSSGAISDGMVGKRRVGDVSALQNDDHNGTEHGNKAKGDDRGNAAPGILPVPRCVLADSLKRNRAGRARL